MRRTWRKHEVLHVGFASDFRDTWSFYGAFSEGLHIYSHSQCHSKPNTPHTHPQDVHYIHTQHIHLTTHRAPTHSTYAHHVHTHTTYIPTPRTYPLHNTTHTSCTYHPDSTHTTWSRQKTQASKDGGKNELCRVQTMPGTCVTRSHVTG